MSRLLLSLPMTLLALSAGAEPAASACEARVVQQLERESAAPLSRQEARAEPEPEPQGSRFDRLVAGLFSMDTRMASKRPGGKYRYLEKD